MSYGMIHGRIGTRRQDKVTFNRIGVGHNDFLIGANGLECQSIGRVGKLIIYGIRYKFFENIIKSGFSV